MDIPAKLFEDLSSLPQPVLIGISGFGGSGKSTLAEQLGTALNAPAISVDSFMKDRSVENYGNWDIMDFDRFEQQVLIPFTSGTDKLRYGHFDWDANEIVETREIDCNQYLIVEGVGLFRPKLLKYFSYKIWIDCPLEIALERGKKRDREVHRNPQDRFWDGIWKTNDQQYFETFQPNEVADISIENH